MPWIPIREAAEDMLKVSRRTVERLIKTGTLPSRLQQGRRLVFLGSADEPASGQRGRKLDPALREHLFDTFEGLSALLRPCLRILAVEKHFEPAFATLPDQEGRPSFGQWKDLYVKIKTCHRTVENMVREMRCHSESLQQIYRDMIGVRLTWAEYAHRHWSDDASPSKRLAGPEDPQVLMTGIIEHLRKLLVGCGGGENHEAGGELS